MARLMLVEGTGRQSDCSQHLGPHGAPPSPTRQACHVEPLQFLELLKLSHLWAFAESVPLSGMSFLCGTSASGGKGCSRVSTGGNRGPQGRAHSSPGLCVPADLAEEGKASALVLNPPPAHCRHLGLLLKWAQSLPCWLLCSGPKMCPALCDPMDYNSLPGSLVHGILQAGTLGWVAAPQTTQITEKRLEHHEGGSTQGYVVPCPLIPPRTPDGPV